MSDEEFDVMFFYFDNECGFNLYVGSAGASGSQGGCWKTAIGYSAMNITLPNYEIMNFATESLLVADRGVSKVHSQPLRAWKEWCRFHEVSDEILPLA